MNFSTVKYLFNWIEGLRRSFIVLVGSDRGLIVDLAGLSKNYLIRWAVKDLFKKFDFLPKSVIVLVVTEKELIVDLAGLIKK